MKGHIIVADDDSDIREVLKIYLSREGFRVFEAEDGNRVLELFNANGADLLILDVMMPDLDGFEVCQLIRKKSDVPVLFLSAKDDDTDKIVGLGIGGDDFISKPFSPSVLTAKVKAQLRRNRLFQQKEEDVQPLLSYNGLVINPDNYSVQMNGNEIQLSAKEFHILTLLAKSPNRVYTTEQIFEHVWGEESSGDFRTVMVHISNLRKKIETDPANPHFILTVRGIGYKFHYSD